MLGEEDDLLALLAEGPPEHVAERRDRLALAVASFDAATIATTHGFCQEMLGGLGIAGDLEPDVTFVEDLSDLASEVVDDLYVRRFSRDSGAAGVRARRGGRDRARGDRQPSRDDRRRRIGDGADAWAARERRARGNSRAASARWR